MPRQVFGILNAEIALHITFEADQFLQTDLVVLRPSATEAIVAKTYFPDYSDDESDGRGELSYHVWPDGLSAAYDRLLGEIRGSAMEDMLSLFETNWNDVFPSASEAAVNLSRWLADRSPPSPERKADLLGQLHERIGAEYISALPSLIAKEAPGLTELALLETTREGEYGGMESWIYAVRLVGSGGESAELFLDDDWLEAAARADLVAVTLRPSEDERAAHAAALSGRYQANDWPACWDAIVKLAVAHHGRRTFVLQGLGEAA